MVNNIVVAQILLRNSITETVKSLAELLIDNRFAVQKKGLFELLVISNFFHKLGCDRLQIQSLLVKQVDA